MSTSVSKPISEMNAAERAQALRELDILEAGLQKQVVDLQSNDPFYWYEPSDGQISPEARAFLAEFLKPDDIPQYCDSQKDAHLCTAETIASFGGNQAGKTTWLVIEALIHATKEIPESLKNIYPVDKLPEESFRFLRIEGESEQQLDDVLIPAFRYWVPRDFLIARSWEASYSAKAKILTLSRHGRECAKIQFNSFTQEVSKLQGKKLTFVGYDEEPPKKHREENNFRFATAKRFCERLAMTPTKGMSWVKEEILDKQDEHVRAFKVASVTNKRANLKVLRNIVEKLTSYESKKMRLLGEFVSLSGLIYGGLFNRQVHMIDQFPVGCNCQQVKENGTHHHNCPWRQYMIVRGLDIHTVKSPAVIEMAVDQQQNLYVVGVYNPKTCPDIQQLKDALAERVTDRGYRVRWSICDKSLDYDIKAASGLNLYKKLIRGTNKVRPCYKSEKFSGSILTGVDEIKQLLKIDAATGRPRLRFFNTPEVGALINDIETLEREVYQNEDKKGTRDEIREGSKDRHAAFRYIFQRRLSWHSAEEPTYVAPAETDDERYI